MMEKKFHLVDGEPKPCTASIRDCPVGGDHFSTEAEGRASYEHNNVQRIFHSFSKHGNNGKSGMCDTTKKIAISAGISAVAIAGTFGAMSMSNSQSQQAQSNYNSTSYSIHLNNSGDHFSATIKDSNLKQTNFDKCVTSPRHNNEDSGRSPIVCKTVDGKFSVRMDRTLKGDDISHASLTIKNNSGKTTNISNFNYSRLSDNSQILIPHAFITK